MAGGAGVAAAVAGAAGVAEVAAAGVGLVQVEVVVTAAVVEPMLVSCCVKVVVKVLYCLIGVTRGAQGSQSSLYGLPGPVGLITTDVFQRLLWVCSLLSSSGSESFLLSADSSASAVSISVACTSLQNGPRKGLLVLLSW